MNKRNSSFFQNTVSLYAMNFAKVFFPIITLPYLTRVLSAETYGMVTYVKAIIVYVQLILDYGFLLSATKKVVLSKENNHKIGQIIGDTIAEKGLLAILAIVGCTILTLNIPILKNNITFLILYVISVLITIFIVDFAFRGLEKMHFVAIPYIAAKFVTTIGTFIYVKNDADILLIPVLEIFGNLLAAIVALAFLWKLKINISFSNMRKWLLDLKESTVYFMSNFATTVFGALTTVIAGMVLDLESVAYWGLCMQFLSAAKALYSPIANSLYPQMIVNKNMDFIKKINKLMMIPMIAGTVIVLFGANNVMMLVGGEQYYEAGYILRALLPAFICSFYSMIYGWPVLGTMGKEKETTLTTIVASGFQILGLLIMMWLNKFTILGLAICCSMTEMILLFSRLYFYKKVKKTNDTLHYV